VTLSKSGINKLSTQRLHFHQPSFGGNNAPCSGRSKSPKSSAFSFYQTTYDKSKKKLGTLKQEGGVKNYIKGRETDMPVPDMKKMKDERVT
jgi:hypothetical protein